MREMKDSGIEWIGEIPQEWNIARLRDIKAEKKYAIVDGPFGSAISTNDYKESGIPLIRITNLKNGEVTENDMVYISEELAEKVGRSSIGLSDIVFAKTGATIGKCGVNKTIKYGILASSCVKISISHEFDHRFFYYIFLTDQFNEALRNTCTGTTRDTINLSPFSKLNVVIPPYKIQQHIADYLDSKCSQIDAIIARQQEVIEKLKAYKLSVITEAVTKGLNHDVPMKDSGVEWIGEIPEHWDFRRIKNCCLIVDCKNRTPDPDPDGEYTVVRTTCIRDGGFSYEGSYHTNAENFKEWTAKGQPQYGDIFFTREAPMGEACLVPDADNLCMGQRVMFFRPLDGSDPRYILYSIYGPLAREYIDSKNKGSTVGHLKLGQVASLPLFYCPPKEQSEIANYLDKRCGAIDKVVEKKTVIISKLADYKKSLIYEVVTGKKEV